MCEAKHAHHVVRGAVFLLVLRCSCAQIDPNAFPDGAPKGGWSQGGSATSSGAALDCQGAWTAWTACDAAARQSRFFEPRQWAANGGEACPAAFAEERVCNYSGPRLLYASGDASEPWRPKCASQGSPATCEWPVISAVVGDSVIFFAPEGRPKLLRLQSTWHYDGCDMSRAEDVQLDLVVSSAGVLINDMYRYIVVDSDRDRSIYLTTPDAGLCARGQRVRVEVEAFQHGNLRMALQLLESEAWKTAQGAKEMVEKLWCTVEHCPEAAVSWYRTDAEAAGLSDVNCSAYGKEEAEEGKAEEREWGCFSFTFAISFPETPPPSLI